MSEHKHPGPSVEQIPDGDDRPRLVCPDCGYIEYRNPRIIVGAVAEWQGRVLLCRRAIPPRRGYWTMPAGYMEMNETAAEGAIREFREEAGAEIDVDELLGVYDIPHIGQVYLIYRGRMVGPEMHAGQESLEVRLFDWHDVPWEELAFPSVHWALRHYQDLRQTDVFTARSNVPETMDDLD